MDNAESTWPLALFVEWAERVPEFRDALAESGLGWGQRGTASVGEDRREVLEPTLPGEAADCCFRAQIGGKYRNVRLHGVVGHIIKVRVEGAPVGAITAIQIGQVSPVDRERVERVMATLPGAGEEVFFDEELPAEGEERGGMQVLPVPLPPPTEDDPSRDV